MKLSESGESVIWAWRVVDKKDKSSRCLIKLPRMLRRIRRLESGHDIKSLRTAHELIMW